MSGSIAAAALLRPEPRHVSVVIATHQGAESIGATLGSLIAQTLPSDLFEVIVVQNGPSSRTSEVVADWRSRRPELTVRQIEYPAPGAGRARNVGLHASRGEYVTFVDDDDTVSPRYLEMLLACSGPRTVGLAHIADVVGDAAPTFVNRLSSQLSRAGERVDPGQLVLALTYTACKMVPTVYARAIGFDPVLRSSEDILFYTRLFLTYGLDISVCPLAPPAIYYRHVLPNSVSRRAPSYDFSVSQRLDVIERLAELTPVLPWQRRVQRHMVDAQTKMITDYLDLHPQASRRALTDAQRRGVALRLRGPTGIAAVDKKGGATRA